MKLEQTVNKANGGVYCSTRSEILASIGAALLFVEVMAWRSARAHDRLLELGFAGVIAWVVICLYQFRHRICRGDGSRPTLSSRPVWILRRELGTASRSSAERMVMARASDSGMHDFRCSLNREGLFRLPVAAKRAASRGLARGLDGIRLQASLSPGQGTPDGDR